MLAFRVTLSTYAHFMPDDDDGRAWDIMDAFFGPAEGLEASACAPDLPGVVRQAASALISALMWHYTLYWQTV